MTAGIWVPREGTPDVAKPVEIDDEVREQVERKQYEWSEAEIADIANEVVRVLGMAHESPYIPVTPHPKQAAFLALDKHKEVGYGGATGPGKSWALLMAALLYADRPVYDALLLRKSFAELDKPGALMSVAGDWLSGKAHYNSQQHKWDFANGATLSFGYLETMKDRYQYQSARYDFIGFDEAGGFRKDDYTFLFSRCRRAVGSDIPPRVRSATNPIGPGLEWYRNRFIVEGPSVGRPFIQGTLEDNPSLDREAYELMLMELDPVMQRQLRHGEWWVHAPGTMFHRERFPVVEIDEVPPNIRQWIRFWDMAATEEQAGDDASGDGGPDWTCGLLLAQDFNDRCYIFDVIRGRWGSEEAEQMVLNTAREDTKVTSIRMEQEPGSSGKKVIDDFARKLRGFAFEGIRATGAKEVRARPVAAAAGPRRKEIAVVRTARFHRWYPVLMAELEAFPDPHIHDDQVDGLSGAYNSLSFRADVSTNLAAVNNALARTRPIAMPTGKGFGPGPI